VAGNKQKRRLHSASARGEKDKKRRSLIPEILKAGRLRGVCLIICPGKGDQIRPKAKGKGKSFGVKGGEREEAGVTRREKRKRRPGLSPKGGEGLDCRSVRGEDRSQDGLPVLEKRDGSEKRRGRKEPEKRIRYEQGKGKNSQQSGSPKKSSA